MVCPLRFVLAGVSAAIVLFLAIDLLWGSSKDDLLLTPEEYDNEDEDVSKLKAPDKPGRLPMPKSVIDLFTGRYLYQVYSVWKQEARRQQELTQHED